METSSLSLIKPKALSEGGTIAVVSPAAPTTDPPDAFEQGVAILEAAGFKVKVFPNAKKHHAYLAGTDEERLSDLHAAFADTSVQGILCSRGGYGCMRLLPQIDFDIIRKNPKVFMGFSDVTALLNPFYQQLGLVGYYSPMLTSNIIDDGQWSLEKLLDVVTGRMEAPFEVSNLDKDKYACFKSGVAEGQLVGGNLTLISSLCGSPWQLDTRGKLLFLEDWKESYYTLDRRFQHLRLAGLFDGIQGLILCDFSEIPDEFDFNLTEQLRRLTADLNVPVGYGFSVGHGEQTATLPIGINARFDADSGVLTLLESPVS